VPSDTGAPPWRVCVGPAATVDCCFRAGGPEHVEVLAQAGARQDSQSFASQGRPRVQVKISEVEGLVLVMPFALLSASST
jgi:hypothetical protein